jgi:hypothetical protein
MMQFVNAMAVEALRAAVAEKYGRTGSNVQNTLDLYAFRA